MTELNSKKKRFHVQGNILPFSKTVCLSSPTLFFKIIYYKRILISLNENVWYYACYSSDVRIVMAILKLISSYNLVL